MTDETTNIKYHSTSQFRNVIKTVKDRAQYRGHNDKGDVIIDKYAVAPVIEYMGTVKLHGTNANIVLHSSGDITLHSKNNRLGMISYNGDLQLDKDNYQFAQTIYQRLPALRNLQKKVISLFATSLDSYPVKISGEWVGEGIQDSVGISHLDKKSFFMFGIKVGDSGWESLQNLPNLENLNSEGIYSITDFKTYSLFIDFNYPELSQNTLVELTEEVEKVCPVSDQLKLTDEEGNPSLLGEGIVWTPKCSTLVKDTGTWFKTKGKKHSVSKTKSVAPIDVEKLNSINEFVEYAITTNRLNQGIAEVGLDIKLVGKYIGWVNKDINKEEADVLKANNLSMKDVGKYCTNKARDFYIKEVNKA